jgi:ribose transport system permease protein
MSMAASTLVPASRPRLGAWLTQQAMLLAGVLLFLAFSLTAASFASPDNLGNILRQTASVLVLGLAMTTVVLVGGIDLSVGSVVLASATVSGAALGSSLPDLAAILLGIATGAVVGAVNALIIEGLGITPVIATLGSMIAVRGLGLLLLQRFNSWIQIDGPVFDALARPNATGIPLDAAVAVILAILVWFVLRHTVFGRALHAVGDAPVATRLAGLRVPSIRSAAYVCCGALAGVAGVLTAARTGLISPTIGSGMEFFAIAVVALGAGGLPAGRVTAGQAVIGALILMMIFNYMTIRGVPGTWQTTATGLLLLAAMVGGRLLQRTRQDQSAAALALDETLSRMSAWGARLSQASVAAATLVLIAIFAAIVPDFLTAPNLVAVVEQNAALAIVAVGATLGIISRTIDISPASVIVLGAVVAALSLKFGLPMPLALVAGILACIAVYALNGLAVGGLGLDPLIVTLAAWIWARGLAVSLTNATTIPFDFGFVTFMNTPIAFGFGPATILVILAFAAGWLILARLPFGLRIYALGGDPRLLRPAGIREARLRVAILLAMSLFTAAAMLVMLGRIGAAAPTAGFGLELDAIVAVIIGGASFRGGVGRLRDTVIGVLFLAILNNGLQGLQMGDAQFMLIKGIAILAALTLRALAFRYFSRRRVTA